MVFDDMIADMINNKNISSVVTELFVRGRKLNISLVFITQSYIKVPKDVRLNSSHFFIMKIPKKRELQRTALNHSSLKIFKKTLALKSSLGLTKNVLLNHLLFWLMMLRLHQIILQDLENIFSIYNKIMTVNVKLEMKNYNMISTEKLPKYQLYHQAKLISMNILLAKINYHLINKK